MTALRCNVADLLHHPAARRPVHLETDGTDFGAVGGTRLDADPLVIDVVIERVPDGVVVRGTVQGVMTADCSRCLRPITRSFTWNVNELFESHPLEGQTYQLEGEEIDLELPIRDTVLLGLPLMPLCTTDCAGVCPQCGIDRNETTCSCNNNPTDARWDALSALTFDD